MGASAVAAPGDAAAAAAAAAVAAFVGDGTAQPGMIAIDLAAEVEDGNSVPLSVMVDSPMTPDNYVSDVLVVADANPWPRVATLHFSPLSGRAEFSTRIRLVDSQTVIVVAKTSDGRLFTARQRVDVIVGACKS